MRILITGGAGFVGSNTAEYFLKKDAYVTVYDNMSRRGVERNAEWLQSKYGKTGQLEILKADVLDSTALQNAVRDVDAIIHTAAQVAMTSSINDPVHDFNVNSLGTMNVLEAARKSGADPIVIFTSTNKVYGDLEDVKIEERKTRYEYKELKCGITETQPLDPISPYGCSKCAADTYTLDYHKTYGLKTIVMRMSCIYGIHQFGTEDQGWVCYFIASTLLDKPITIYGDGKQVRDVLYVTDLIKAFELAMKNINKTKGKAYNIGGGQKNTYSLLELIEYLRTLTGKKISPAFSEWRLGDQKVYYSNITRAKKDFGWTPEVDKKEGVKMLLDWVKGNLNVFKTFFA